MRIIRIIVEEIDNDIRISKEHRMTEAIFNSTPLGTPYHLIKLMMYDLDKHIKDQIKT